MEIRASDVVLDCRGARIEDTTGEGNSGIRVQSPADVALSNITIRNCIVKGFLNSVRIQREGFKELVEGQEYENAYSDIVVENDHFYSSRGSGVFVDGYVTDVTLRDLDIMGAGGVGIYLEAGSKDNLVEHNRIVQNGHGDVTAEGVPFELGGQQLRYRSTGREGIAIDGSRNNVVRHNVIGGNAAGGIFLYKNCGEYMSREGRHWVRRYGADGNLIEDNLFILGPTGVWIGSRMAENQYFLECSDPAYISESLRKVHRDYAASNTIRSNRFTLLKYGVRVEDDGTRLEDNRFVNQLPESQAVVIGTKERTAALGEPVDGTVVDGNETFQGGNPHPYGWIYGHENTSYGENLVDGVPVSLVEGTPPPINPFLFVIEFWPDPAP